jgi:FkbM family methyltransferase
MVRHAIRPLAVRARRALVRIADDPWIPYRVGAYDLDLPLSHDLPLHRAANVHYDTAIGRVARAAWEAHPGSSIIDIGANVGDTAALMRSSSPAPILCIEGSARFFELLRSNAAILGTGIYLEHALVGGGTVARGSVVEGRGTARVIAGGDAPVELEPLAVIVKRWPALPRPALVKIDTDGFDCPIVESAIEFWGAWKPILFFEFDPDFYPPTWSSGRMFESLRSVGYDLVLAYENTGEYRLATRLADARALEELHRTYVGRGHERYADLCIFHGDDRELAESFRRVEESRMALGREVPRPRAPAA